MTLGMVKDVQIAKDLIKVQVELTTPACPLKEIIARDIKQALAKIAGCPDVAVDFSADVSGRNVEQGDLAPGIRNIIGGASGKGPTSAGCELSPCSRRGLGEAPYVRRL